MQQAFPILLLNSKIHVPKPNLSRFPLCRLSPLSVRPFILPPHISMATDTLRDEAQPPRPQASGFSFGDAWAKATAKLSAGRGTPADPPLVSGQHGSETTSVPAWAQTETSPVCGGGRGVDLGTEGAHKISPQPPRHFRPCHIRTQPEA